MMKTKEVNKNPYVYSFQRVDIQVIKDLKTVLDNFNYYDLDKDVRQKYKDFLDELDIEIKASER